MASVKLTCKNTDAKDKTFKHDDLQLGEAVLDVENDQLFVKTDDGWVVFAADDERSHPNQYDGDENWYGRRVRITEIVYGEV